MRLNKATLTFAGTAAALAVTTLTASPAWACNDRDPALRLEAKCGTNGQPNWFVINPNRWGAVPFTWSDNQHGQSDSKIQAPAGGGVALPTHASVVKVVAYRPDRSDLPVWQRHGAYSVKHCVGAPKPSKPAHPHPSAPPKKHTPKPTPTKPSTATPSPTTSAPTGEARPATPVKAQPKFTG
ncbi:hypothetical protein GCM10023196_082520 [Actinoallomurus vinaceus]|uniref:Uncharacterized protein n=1 Tax=Actinoallomurus vinaceus TaxID=1080074 RepID=A0ABP8UNG1_9ACTN